MNPTHINLGLSRNLFTPVTHGLLGSAPPVSARPSRPYGPIGAYHAAGTPYSARGTPYSAAPAPYTAAGTPGRVLRAAADGDEMAVDTVSKCYNPCVESVLNPTLPTQWSGNFEYYTTTVSVGGYAELRVGAGINNGAMLVILPSRNAQPDVFILGRSVAHSILVPYETPIRASRDLYTSYTRGRCVSMHAVLTSASQSTTGARTPGYLHGFALQSLRDIAQDTDSPNQLMTQTVTPADISLQNDTFGGVCSILAPDGVGTNMRQFQTDQVEASATTWHVNIPDVRVTTAGYTSIFEVPKSEPVFNDRPIKITLAAECPDAITGTCDIVIRLSWLHLNGVGTAVESFEDSEKFIFRGTGDHGTLIMDTSSTPNITKRLWKISLGLSQAQNVDVRGGRFSVAGYLDDGQFTTPTVFMPSAYDNGSNITIRFRFADQLVPNSILMPDVATRSTAHSAMTRADIESTSALFANDGPLRRVMSLDEYKTVMESAARFTFCGSMDSISSTYRAASAQNAARNATYLASGGFFDFLKNVGSGIMHALPVAGQIASTVLPLLAAPQDRKRKAIGFAMGADTTGPQAERRAQGPRLLEGQGASSAGRPSELQPRAAHKAGQTGHDGPRRPSAQGGQRRERRGRQGQGPAPAKTRALHPKAPKARDRRSGSMSTQSGSRSWKHSERDKSRHRRFPGCQFRN